MRKIEKEVREAVRTSRSAKFGNTAVEVTSEAVSVFLHGSEIYRKAGDVEYFTLAGWNTSTTRGRLRALGLSINCRDFAPYFCGHAIAADKVYRIEGARVESFREEIETALRGPFGRSIGGAA